MSGPQGNPILQNDTFRTTSERTILERPRSYLATRPPDLGYQMGGCGIAGCISVQGKKTSGEHITRMLTTMSERENGLGAGYACYGLFPDRRDEFCIQLLLDDEESKCVVEELLKDFEEAFKVEVPKDWEAFSKICPNTYRPFSGHYDPTLI
ncbi:MAG: hypothetical protein LUQ55_01705 [Methanomassiliicoccales archaeon]|nr:hypothetical protein [Methanomassiliicoccales archaeon]